MYRNILIIICSVSSILNIIYNQLPLIYNINISYINNICNDTHLNNTNINNTNINNTNINNTNLNYTNINNTNLNNTNNICNDSNIYCSNWSKYNECIANPIYMLNNCKKSCDTCNLNSSNIDKLAKIYSNICIDLNNMCINWTMQGECQKNPMYMLERCKKSCKVC